MRLVILVVAFLAVGWGVVTGNPLVLIGGVVISGLVLRKEDEARYDEDEADSGTGWEQTFQWLQQASQQVWALGLLAALGLSVTAGMLNLRDPFRRDLIWIWLAGLLLTVGTALWHDYQARSHYVSALSGATITDGPSGRESGWGVGDWVLMLFFVAVAVGLRMWRLDNNLPGVHGDEGEMGMLALLALHGPASGISPNPLPYFTTAFLDHPTLFHYLQAGAMALFGETMNGLRMLSILTGGLVVGGLYLMGRAGWGRGAAIFMAGFGATSHFYIHYSRIALNNIESVFFLVLIVWLFILVARRNGTPGDRFNGKVSTASSKPASILPFVWIGLSIGLSQYFYYGSRLIPPLVVLFIAFLLFQRRMTIKESVVVVFVALVAAGPLLIFFGDHPYTFFNRSEGVTILGPEAMRHLLGPDAQWPNDLPQLFWKQIQRNLMFFVNIGDFSAFYLADIPAFDRITVLLLWLGVAPFFVRIKRFPEFAVTVWLISGVFLGGVMTKDAPNGPRLIMAAVTVFVIVGALIQYALRITKKHIGFGAVRLVLALAVVALFLSAVLNYRAYFDQYYHTHPNAMPATIAEEMVAASPRAVYLFGAPNFFVEYGVLRFLARGVQSANADSVDQLPLPGEADENGILVIALPHRADEIDATESRLPGGVRGEAFDRFGRLLYYTYRYPAESN